MVIDFIPLPIYTPIFNYLILFLVMIVFFQSQSGNIFSGTKGMQIFGVVLALFVILYIGCRPISGIYFGDTSNYARSFQQLRDNFVDESVSFEGEWFFYAVMRFFTQHGDVHSFFLFCATVYVGCLWVAMKRFFGEQNYIPFLVALSMFSFWSYGVNGVRNGMASSIVILALSFRPKYLIMGALCFVALGIHKSLALTIGAAILAYYYTNSKHYLFGWFVSIVLSAVGGTAVANLLLSSGLIEDDRFADYLNSTANVDQFSQTGFRWDFLLYSAIPVAVGYYFIVKRNYKDKIYIWLYNIYLTTNAFWIIVIEAAFSNRFAQISWFIMPLVLIYPFFKAQFWSDQSKRTGIAVVAFYLFTFYSHILTRFF